MHAPDNNGSTLGSPVYNSIIFSSTSVNDYSVLNTSAYISKNKTEGALDSADWKNITLCWNVTAFNFAKGVLMLFFAFGMGEEDPLMTIGDAVQYNVISNRNGSLGAMQIKTILDTGDMSQGSILANILLVNTPQIILSVIYSTYTCNAQYTSISLITEWDRFGNEKEAKSLRVSSTRSGAQRDTYFLQLPYRYSFPLVIFPGGLHWLISQSFFLVNLEVYVPSADGKSMVRLVEGNSFAGVTAYGWSPLGVFCILVVIIFMMGFLIITERRRLRFRVMPVAGSCGAAISAACHLGSDEGKMWEKTLR
ncbi:hypothetical protein CABS02_08832 [Colletotrichum abscissum]|uniref:Uncharacterized protein n=1 Tax=Colletotrichum abscissum TaxID=1671311 RepID=A0A9P9XBZ7_9PEZI|nr:hypothetical protein CABS02_08832 [Colletotrichum abscissum]